MEKRPVIPRAKATMPTRLARPGLRGRYLHGEDFLEADGPVEVILLVGAGRHVLGGQPDVPRQAPEQVQDDDHLEVVHSPCVVVEVEVDEAQHGCSLASHQQLIEREGHQTPLQRDISDGLSGDAPFTPPELTCTASLIHDFKQIL